MSSLRTNSRRNQMCTSTRQGGREWKRERERERESARARRTQLPPFSHPPPVNSSANCLGELTAVGDDDLLAGCAGSGSEFLDGGDNVKALGYVAEDGVLAVQPCGFHRAEEELGSVGVWAGVGHGENTCASVLEREVLVGEFFTVDGLSARTVVSVRWGEGGVKGGRERTLSQIQMRAKARKKTEVSRIKTEIQFFFKN